MKLRVAHIFTHGSTRFIDRRRPHSGARAPGDEAGRPRGGLANTPRPRVHLHARLEAEVQALVVERPGSSVRG